MRTLVIGDIHGAYKALIQCFKRAGFNPAKDTLIVLGDVCDGWHQVPECIEELIKIKNLIYVLGNHDWWCNDWLQNGRSEPVWELQGGQATKDAYINQPEYMIKHRHFFDVAKPYYLYENKLFVHGGIPPSIIQRPIEKQELWDLMWDRELYKVSKDKHNQKPNFKYGGYDKIFIGHTTTQRESDKPVHFCNVWNLDQGAGWNGKLTIMDVDTEEYWQSDNVLKLYPGVKGRF